MNYCTVCGNEIDKDHRFCSQCGSCLSPPIQTAGYRFVTILFTDLSNYSRLTEELDHEELRVLIDSVMRKITENIIEFGGSVEKYIGDAVLAIFGKTKTREDDPIRAILAACKIHTAVEQLNALLPVTCKIHLSMHTGINTGEVLLDSAMAYHSSHSTLGKSINVASRLCDLATQGEILIGESLVSEASRHFYLEWMGRRLLKGFRIPIHVYKILQERSTPVAIHRSGGVTSPLVGRDHELSVLLSKARELHKGRGGVIYISGDAGVGKSRLIHEFKSSLDDDITFISSACFDHASSTPYFPFIKLVRSILNLEERVYEIQEITRILTQCGLPQEFVAHLDFFIGKSFCNGYNSPDLFKEKMSDAVLELCNAHALSHITIFCIEDIHWADQSTLDLLNYLIHKWTESFRCLLILTHRPDTLSALPGSRLCLRDLSKPDVGKMLSHMVDAAMIPDSSVHFLREATGGNPFYIEELTNYLLEKGLDLSDQSLRGILNNDVPMTLYGLIASRLDHMGASAKRLLQEASHIGRMFSETLLASVCSNPGEIKADLSESVKHGFITHMGDGEYMFKHDITRDVVNRALLKQEKISLHKKIGFFWEHNAGSCRGDTASKKAHHFGLAHDHAKAMFYHMEAGKSCQASGSWVEAGGHFLSAEHHALADMTLPGAEEKIVEIREGIWRCYRVFIPVQAIAALESLIDYYHNKGLIEQEAYCYIRLINLYSQKGLFGKAKECYRYVLTLIPDNPVLIAAAQTAIAYTYTFLGKPLEALELLDKSRPALMASDQFLYIVNSLTTLSACVWKGDIAGSHIWYEQTKMNSRAYMDIDLMADILLAHICCLEGSFRKARRLFEDVLSREKKLGKCIGGLSYLRIQGSIYFRSRYFGDIHGARKDLDAFDALGSDINDSGSLKELYQAWIALEEGNPGQAKDHIYAALPRLKKGIANRIPYALNALAEANLLMGDLAEAKRVAQESITWNEQSGNMDQLIWGLRLFADICIVQHEENSAQRTLKRAYGLARGSRMKPHQAWIIASWGRLHKAVGTYNKAALCFGKSLKLWKEMGNALQVKQVGKELICIKHA